MVNFSLFFVRLFRKLIQLWGVDYDQFETLLQNKLTLDFRRNPNHLNASSNKKQTFLKQLFIFAVLGGFIELSLMQIDDLMLSQTILFSMIMVMLATTLINEFTSVLFDERDNDILLVRPISHRTLLLSRLMHIQFYMGFIALALALIPGIVIIFKFNLLISLAFFIGVGLSTWVTLLFTIFFYLALSKVVKGEKFKDYVTYLQILLAIVIFGGYQLLPRMIDTDSMKHFSMTVHWWTYLIPPAWLAGFVKFFTFNHALNTTFFFLLAVAIPFTGSIVIVRFLSKGFGEILGQKTVDKITNEKKKTTKENFSERMNRLFCVTETEKLGWKLTMKTTQRDRKFKQAVYPMLVFIPVMAIMILKPDFSNLMESIQKLGDTHRYLYFIFLGFFSTMSILQLPYTDTPEASWIYKALPFRQPGHIISGSVKALLYRFFFPVYAFLILCALLIWNIRVFPEMLLGGILTILMTLIMVVIQQTGIPFTQARESQQKGNTIVAAILGSVMMGAIVGLVYLSSSLVGWLILIFCLVAIGLVVFTNRAIRSKNYQMN